jgi:hypothetical protein
VKLTYITEFRAEIFLATAMKRAISFLVPLALETGRSMDLIIGACYFWLN